MSLVSAFVFDCAGICSDSRFSDWARHWRSACVLSILRECRSEEECEKSVGCAEKSEKWVESVFSERKVFRVVSRI